MNLRWRLTTCAVTAATGLGLLAVPAAAGQQPAHESGCTLANGIKHVISIQFDNVHFTRDNPNVPSDLEQMPNLLNFLERNGTVMSNFHDVLVHTATNFVSSLTGLYEDRTSVTQSNSFSYFDPTGKPTPACPSRTGPARSSTRRATPPTRTST